jgi:hypothetical protein
VKKLLFLFLVLMLLTACGQKQATNDMLKTIRPAAVAGQFYPNEPGAITDQIRRYLKQALAEKIEGRVKAIIVPHAGYDYSGAAAAYAFKQLEGKKINTAVIISNSHKAYFDGIAIDDSDGWQTPLGTVAVDKELAEKLIAAGGDIKYDGSIHKEDHVLEVEIPFLQTVLEGDFKILPILFGNQDEDSYKKLAEALKDNLSQDDIVIISTDMSHYPEYEDANKIDKETLEKIKTATAEEFVGYIKGVESAGYANEQTALCGIDAVKTAIELARLAGWDKVEILKYANSGDAPLIGDKARVVGYGTVAFAKMENVNSKMQNDNEKFKNINELSDEQKKKLLDIARQTVESYVKNSKIPEFNVTDERLNQKQGAFVTLEKDGRLRGCIGQIVPSDEPLWQVVRDMAVAACSEDGRFNPVSEDELSKLEYEVSVLSTPEPIDDWQKIELGRHGVIIRRGAQSGVFLPQVATDTGWTLEEFLSELCWQKAGLAPDCYKDKSTQILTFTAQVFK